VKQVNVKNYASNILHGKCTTLNLQMPDRHKSPTALRTSKRSYWRLKQLFGSHFAQ